MPSPAEILESPDYLNANAATKRAIFDRHIASDPDFAKANAPTKKAIFERFGLSAPAERETTTAEGLARGMAPYVGGAGVGAVAGGVIGGLVGGPPGAVAGATLGARAVPIALGIQDFGTGLYNVVANRFGAPQATPLSEGLKNVAESVGVGRPGAPIAEAIGSGAAGAGSQALALSRAAPATMNAFNVARGAPTVGEGVRNVMAAQPGTQALAGGLAGTVSGTLQAGGETDPLTLMLASMAGSSLTPAAIVGLRAANRAVTERLPAMLDPLATKRAQLAGDKGPQLVEAMRANLVSETGAPLMTAQASADAGAPGYSATMDAAARQLAADQRFDMLQAQKQSRDTALMRAQPPAKPGAQVTNPPEEIASMTAARDRRADREFGRIRNDLVEEDAVLTDLFKTPAMRDVVRVAREITANRQEPFQFGQTRAASVAESPIVDASGNKILTETPAEFAKFPVGNLYTIKKAMDDLIKNPADFGIGAEQARAIGGVRAKFMDWVESQVPAVAEARGQFKTASTPINQKTMLETLRNTLLSSTGAGERAAAYANVVKSLTSFKDAPQALRRLVSGAPRYEKLEDALSPAQIKTVDDVRIELSRDAKLQELVRAARGAISDVNKIGTEMTGEKGLVNPLDPTIAIVNRLIMSERGKLNRKLAMELALESLNPKVAADALERSLARQAKFDRFRLPEPAPLSAGATAAAALPTAVNALSRDNQNAMAR
jgi:hypothetical protein